VKAWEQPIDDVKEYFGEKVALYFEFTGHYTYFLTPLSILGFFVLISIIVEASLFNSLGNAFLNGCHTILLYLRKLLGTIDDRILETKRETEVSRMGY
jgi:hypothetical protein